MTRRLLAAAFALAMAASSSAARAELITVAGTLGLEMSFQPTVSIASPGVATADVSPGSHLTFVKLAGGTFNAAGLIADVTNPGAAPIEGILLTATNDNAVFAQFPAGHFGGFMKLGGTAKVCLFTDCNAPIVPANLSLPLNVVGSVGAVAFVASSVNITVRGAPWTTATAAVSTVTRMGFAHGPASNTSSTGNLSGVVQLVTPIFVSTSIPAFAVVPSFGTLTLHIVPEPGTAILLGSGVLGLAALGRHKRRGSPPERRDA